MRAIPETSYVTTPDGTYIAYQVAGSGPVDVALEFNSDESNVDLMWDEPDWRPLMTGITEFARLILHDKRGVGVSSRNVPPPNLETRVSDFLAVLRAAGSERPILLGGAQGGAMQAMFAATHPDRASGLVWNNPVARTAWAQDYPWGLPASVFDQELAHAGAWGTSTYGDSIAAWRQAERMGLAGGEAEQALPGGSDAGVYARINRNTATPDVAHEIFRIDWETDVRAILPSVHTPVTLVTGTLDRVEEARFIGSLIPGAAVHVLEGRSGVAYRPILEILRKVAGVHDGGAAFDTVLSTVLFTDIVDSTARQAAVGDRAWKRILLAHHELMRDALKRWRGVENDTAGDGFYATFDGPARAIRCAIEVCGRVRDLGIAIRAGVHIGECEVVDGKFAGITVSIGARVAAAAGPSEVLVSQTIKDLVAGSGFVFEDVGEHVLKGVPGPWHLYRVAT